MIEIRRWQNKESKKFFKVLPWWEVIDPLVSDKDVVAGLTFSKDHKFKIGALIQIGWLLENGHGVWFGLNKSAEKQFKDLGAYSPKRKPRKRKTKKR